MNVTLITWLTFIGVFGGAGIYWWIGGGYKKYLKYVSDYRKEKERLAKLNNQDGKQTNKNKE